MAPDDHSGARPAGPVVLRIKLRYDDVNAMVQRFASNVGKSGLFLPTKSIQPIGTEVKFELRLSNDTPVLVGLGRVKHAKHPDPANPRAAFGMAIELMRVSREGREIIIRMIERRRALGLADVAIPMPEDVDQAKRAEIESQPRADTGGIVRGAMAQVASAPVAEEVLPARGPASGPIGVARDAMSGPISMRDSVSGPISMRDSVSGPIESPRESAPIESLRESAPIVIPPSPSVPVPVLAPEKSRPRRPRPQELIAKAAELSGPISTTPPELDMQVDIESVLSRARALAGGDLENELAALREAAAAPTEISVEAASAELARALGGKAIAKRERSARWEPPPPVELRSELPPADFAMKTRAETEASPSAVVAAVVDAATQVGDPIEESPSVVPEEAYVLRKSGQLAHEYPDEGGDVYESVANDPASEHTRMPTGDDEYDAASRAFGGQVITEPQPTQLMIDDDADVSSFERALDAARIHTGVSAAAPARADDADFPANERTQIGEPIGESSFGVHYPDMSDQLAAQLDRQLDDAEQDDEVRRAMDQEVSDLDVLAEADEEDADLLEPQPRSSYDDFASRLDLGDDEDEPNVHQGFPPPAAPSFDQQAAQDFEQSAQEDFDRQAAREFDAQPGYIPPEEQYLQERERGRRSQQRYSGSSDFVDQPSSSYTFAENFPQAGLQFSPHEGGEEFDEPHGYAPPPVADTPRRARRPSEVEQALADLPATPPARPQPSEDLEDALAALDVDLGDIAPNRRSRRPSGSSSPRPLPGLPPVERSRDPEPPRSAAPTPARAVAHTVQRQASTTGPNPAPSPAPARPAQATGPVKSTAKPPPIPAAARMKPPTQQQPIVRQPPQRAATDDGILIDFDEDE